MRILTLFLPLFMLACVEPVGESSHPGIQTSPEEAYNPHGEPDAGTGTATDAEPPCGIDVDEYVEHRRRKGCALMAEMLGMGGSLQFDEICALAFISLWFNDIRAGAGARLCGECP